MSEYITVASVSEIPAGTGRTVEVGGVWVAVFNLDGTFYAIDNACPHAGGPLGEGKLCDTNVECPGHGWKFNVVSGERVGNPNFQVARCDVRVIDDRIEIRLPAELQFSSIELIPLMGAPTLSPAPTIPYPLPSTIPFLPAPIKARNINVLTKSQCGEN